MGDLVEADFQINRSEDGDFLAHSGDSARQQGRNRFDFWGTIPFRKTARATDERTLIVTSVPRSGMSDRAPLLSVATGDTAPLIVALFNSFVVDFAARSAVGGTDLSYFIIKQLPILHPALFQDDTGWGHTYADFIVPRVLELTYTSSEMQDFAKHLGYEGHPFPWNEDCRLQLRCEIDAALFHLYGMEREDVDYIMDTFPIVKRDEKRSFGEYRTKRVILEIYDEMATANMTGNAYQARLARSPKF